jgi:bla regulator protein BlaR1
LGLALRPAQWPQMEFIPEPLLTGFSSLVHAPFGASAIDSAGGVPDPEPLLLVIWALGGGIVLGSWIAEWLRIRATVRAATRVPMEIPVEARVSTAFTEPGIFGVLKPVLLLPKDLVSRMSAAELEAVVAHEMCHVRRRDNLAAAAHRLVEALFWFNPVIWWIGGRLLEERERACDEQVVEFGTAPRVYAEGILKSCRVSLEARLGVIAGASGVKLKERIEEIVGERSRKRLGPCGTAALLAVLGATLLLPLSVGIATPRLPESRPDAQRIAPASFERLAVSRTSDTREPPRVSLERGRLSMRNATLRRLISVAFSTEESRIFGGPYWLDDRYDIDASTSVPLGEDVESTHRRMILRLLKDRFELTFVERGGRASR